MLEYVLGDASMPVRTAADKLTTDARGQMAQTKRSLVTKRLVSCDPRVHAAVDPATGKIAPQMSANGAAQRALGCRGYSLFDIRVDAVSGRPFIIECCAFWSFSPISVLSHMLEASGIDYKHAILDLWREHSLTPVAAKRRTRPQSTSTKLALPADTPISASVK